MIKARASLAEARMLVSIAICELCDFFNVGKNMNDTQVLLTADLIIEQFWHLHPEEIKYCFCRAMSTAKVYDRIDGNIILGWLSDYDQERTEEAMRQSDADDAQTMGVGGEADCMPFDQYAERLRRQADCGDKQAQSLLTYINSTCQSQQMRPQTTKADFRQWFFNQYLTGKWKQNQK